MFLIVLLQQFHNFFDREIISNLFLTLDLKPFHLLSKIYKYLQEKIDDKEDKEPSLELF